MFGREQAGSECSEITADWNSHVVREALLRKGFRRRAGRLHVQVQEAAAERRDADVHLLRRITDVARKSRWAHFVEVKDLHLADLIQQAEEHHRDRKPDPFPRTTAATGDDSSGDRGALYQEGDRAPRAGHDRSQDIWQTHVRKQAYVHLSTEQEHEHR